MDFEFSHPIFGVAFFVGPDRGGTTADESVLDSDGKLSVEKLAPVCYDTAGHGYYVMERRVGNAFSDGKEIK